MQNPVIMAVDDDAAVLAAVVRDLRREYGRDHRILRPESGEAALEALRALKLREEPVALLVVDQRMPGMSGVEMLREAVRLHPGAKRVLLTAYADTDAAIRAINEVRLDHYLMKPWDPPEEQLYPVLTDLLDDWHARHRPSFQGVRVVGHPWSADGHRIRDFLVRNLTPYRWLDVEEDGAAARELLEVTGTPESALPLVVFPDGSHLSRPGTGELAARIGLHTAADTDRYDLVILGGGPAGLAAAVYGASEGLDTLLVEKQAPGGQAGTSARIENYLGFPAGLSGGDLTRRAVAQARRLGAEILTPREATGIELRGDYRIVQLDDGSRVQTQAVLITTGVSYRLLDVPGAARLTGAGIYYGAAMTEAAAVRGRDVLLVGGGNSAGQAAMYLSRFARRVTLLVRGPSLHESMSSYLIAQLEQTDNISVRTDTTVAAVEGERSLEGVVVETAGERERLPAAALFVFIGALPRTDWVPGAVDRDHRGYILSGPDVLRDGRRPPGWNVPRDPLWLETSVPGIFVAGDVRHRSVKRIASAVGEGAMAVQFVHVHLKGAVLGRPGEARRETPDRAAGANAPTANAAMIQPPAGTPSGGILSASAAP